MNNTLLITIDTDVNIPPVKIGIMIHEIFTRVSVKSPHPEATFTLGDDLYTYTRINDVVFTLNNDVYDLRKIENDNN
jgi:hypothetical protein